MCIYASFKQNFATFFIFLFEGHRKLFAGLL